MTINSQSGRAGTATPETPETVVTPGLHVHKHAPQGKWVPCQAVLVQQGSS